MAQEDSTRSAVSYQEKVLENDSKSSDEENSAATPNPNIQKQIDEKLENSSSLESTVQKLQEQIAASKAAPAETPSDPEQSGSFACFASVKSTDYHLRHSFILNPATNSHVCNDRSRIYD